MTFAILPVKKPVNAKLRLAGYLAAAHRETLARLMFEKTIAALCEARGIDRVVVVTSDLQIAARARKMGADLFEEIEQLSHSASADAACRRAIELGAATVLLVPIDVPLASPADFEHLASSAAAHSGCGLGIVPSADGTGTNALVRTPPDVIPSRFGPGSFDAHLGEANSRGITAAILPMPGLMFDIDTPEDVSEYLARANGDCHIARFLRETCPSR
jgi:2-phospho-L-lactate guanylyltransferase